jgi:hypothetical protein
LRRSPGSDYQFNEHFAAEQERTASAWAVTYVWRKKKRDVREEPTRVFTVGDLQEVVDLARAAGLFDDAPVWVQTRRGRKLRREVAEMRLGTVDWLDPADDYRVLLLVARSQWRPRDPAGGAPRRRAI